MSRTIFSVYCLCKEYSRSRPMLTPLLDKATCKLNLQIQRLINLPNLEITELSQANFKSYKNIKNK